MAFKTESGSCTPGSRDARWGTRSEYKRLARRARRIEAKQIGLVARVEEQDGLVVDRELLRRWEAYVLGVPAPANFRLWPCWGCSAAGTW
jgi:hypothetical protein